MGRKGNWFSSVKKALSPESKEKTNQVWRNPVKMLFLLSGNFGKLNWFPTVLVTFFFFFQKSNKSKKKWFGKRKQLISDSTASGTATLPPLRQHEEVELTNGENEQNEHAYSVAVATTVAAEPAVVAAQAATEVVRVTTVTRFAGKSREEAAVIKIQTAFRGYMVYVIFFYSFCFFPPYLMQAIWFNASEVLT